MKWSVKHRTHHLTHILHFQSTWHGLTCFDRTMDVRFGFIIDPVKSSFYS